MTVLTDITDWLHSLPVFTRCWFGLSVLFPILSRFGLVDPQYLVLSYVDFLKGLQIWRPVTAMFVYPMNFHYLENLYILCTYSTRLETGHFDGNPAHYLFMLLFNWICIVVSLYVGSWLSSASRTRVINECRHPRRLLMDPMVLSVLYVWCQLHENVIVNFWFGTQFRAIYIPWVLFVLNLMISGGGLYELIGILVGHLSYLLFT
ncbi:derlin-1-like [Dermacentor andersoni]|uniref:derlin-1-like n=1 Tax=Dermacentor andersoni TaxID=34620 RepID=UPI003B3AE9ED